MNDIHDQELYQGYKKCSFFYSGDAILGPKESSLVECFNVIDCEKLYSQSATHTSGWKKKLFLYSGGDILSKSKVKWGQSIHCYIFLVFHGSNSIGLRSESLFAKHIFNPDMYVLFVAYFLYI